MPRAQLQTVGHHRRLIARKKSLHAATIRLPPLLGKDSCKESLADGFVRVPAERSRRLQIPDDDAFFGVKADKRIGSSIKDELRPRLAVRKTLRCLGFRPSRNSKGYSPGNLHDLRVSAFGRFRLPSMRQRPWLNRQRHS